MGVVEDSNFEDSTAFRAQKKKKTIMGEKEDEGEGRGKAHHVE